VPKEVTAGDYVVTVESAALPGMDVRDTNCDHLTIKEDPRTMKEVAEILRTP
jgi:hypothetical protein